MKPWLEVVDIDLVTKVAAALSISIGFRSLRFFPTAFRRLELPIDIRSLKRWWKGLRKTLRAAILANYEKSTWNWPVD